MTSPIPAQLQRPGVYISETLAPPRAATGVTLSNAVFIGTSGRGPTTVTALTSFGDFSRLYGGFDVINDLSLAVYQFFTNGGRQAYVLRVLVGSETVASVGLHDREVSSPPITLTVSAANAGVWGNTVYVAITDVIGATGRFNLTVYYGGSAASNTVERWSDLSMDPASSRYVASIVNSATSGSSYISVAVGAGGTGASFADQVPAATGTGSGSNFVVVPTPLTGGADAGGSITASTLAGAVNQVDNILSPVSINYPGVTDPNVVNPALSYAEQRGDCFVVIDGTTTTSATVAAQVTLAQSYVSPNGGPSSYGAVYFPRIVISDPTSRSSVATRTVASGGAVLGLFAATDASAGVQRTPAGYASRIAGAVGTEVPVTDTDAGTLNSNQINAVRAIPGYGVVVLGGRTMRSGYVDKYISARRSLIYIKANLKLITNPLLFEPNDSALYALITAQCEQFLRNFWQQRGLRGATEAEAFYVVCDSTNNTTATVANGEVHVQVGVSLQVPAEFIVINVAQYDGGASAAEVNV